MKLQNRVADIVKHLELEGDRSAPLVVAIRHYQDKRGGVSYTAPITFLTDEEQNAVVEGTGTFRVSLYKALLFVKIAEAIKAGILNVRHSYKYRSLDDYLIPKQAWEANREAYLFMDQFELPEVYRRQPGMLHTSSDGQKFEVAVESLHSTYSYKYFDQRQGVSIYTFIDERHFLWHHAVISAAERDASYVIDGLMHNDVVQSDLHSTDTHGYTEILFGVLHLLGFAFAHGSRTSPHSSSMPSKSGKIMHNTATGSCRMGTSPRR